MTPSQLIAAIHTMIRANRPFFVWGPPGVGKSAIMRAVAQSLGYVLIDLRAVLLDPVDLRGLPHVDSKGYSNWAIPNFLPNEERHGKKGILFLDELNAAPPLVQAACYQLVLDRALGEYRLPEGWIVCAAGNNDTDGAVTSRMPTPLRTRFASHLTIPVVENKKYPGCLTFANIEDWREEWTQWATKNDLHPTVIAHARAVPELLYLFDKNAKTFPCLRTWEFLSDIIKAQPPANIEYQMFEGCVGGPAATSIYTFIKLYRELPDMDDILADPKKAKVPSDPSTLFLICSALATKANAKNFKAVCEYCDRMPPEYSVLTIKDSVMKTRALATTKEFVNWSMKHGSFVVD